MRHIVAHSIAALVVEPIQCIGGDIVDEVPLAPTVSWHLQELKDIGIIKGSIEGVLVNYCIDPDRWQEIQTMLNNLFNTYVSGQALLLNQ